MALHRLCVCAERIEHEVPLIFSQKGNNVYGPCFIVQRGSNILGFHSVSNCRQNQAGLWTVGEAPLSCC